jgi:hypothetical protein
VYSDVWTQLGQAEPSVPLVIYDGSAYSNAQSQIANPLLSFYIKTLNEFANNNPDARKRPTISLDGITELAHVFRFANRFYNGIAGNESLPSDLSNFISNHIVFSNTASTLGYALTTLLAGFLEELALTEFNVSYFSGIVYPKILKMATDDMSTDARSLVSYMYMILMPLINLYKIIRIKLILMHIIN